MRNLITRLSLTTAFALAMLAPAQAVEESVTAASKQTSIGTLYLLCEYDGEDLVVNWTAKPSLPGTLISVVSGTIRFGAGGSAFIGGVPEGVRVRGMPHAGGQEILTVGPDLDPLDAWVSAEADMVTVGLAPHSGTTPTVEVDCDYVE